jgi:hypothetical protein
MFYHKLLDSFFCKISIKKLGNFVLNNKSASFFILSEIGFRNWVFG